MSKTTYIWVIIVVIIIGYLVYASGLFESIKTKSSPDYLNIKDFALNPEKYEGQNVTISGKFRDSFLVTNKGTAKQLVDNEGYKVYFISTPYRSAFEEGKTYVIHGSIEKYTSLSSQYYILIES